MKTQMNFYDCKGKHYATKIMNRANFFLQEEVVYKQNKHRIAFIITDIDNDIRIGKAFRMTRDFND